MNTIAVTQYWIGGRLCPVDQTGIIGGGQEGVVLADQTDPRRCVKIYYPDEPGNKDDATLAAYRARKVEAICQRRLTLPAQFALPLQPVYDALRRQIIGFQMHRIPPGYHKLLMLADITFRNSQQIGLRRIVELFRGIFGDLELLHQLGLRIGDVNPGAVLFQTTGERAWVDTDSWSFPPQFPCLAVTERFAHPGLYPNLEKGGTFVPPEPHHDRFAFLVLFTMLAIPGSHPFATGKHPSVNDLKLRAQAGITCFDPDVTPPKVVSPPDVLSDDLLEQILRRLKRQTDAPLGDELLAHFASEIVTCNKCGAEYHQSRRHCPACHEMTLTQLTAVNFIIEELFRVQGTLLFVQTVGTNLYLVCRTNDRVRIIRIDEQGTAIQLSPDLESIPGARYRFFGDCLVVCPDPDQPDHTVLELYKIEEERLHRLQDTSTEVLAGETAVFDTSSQFLYRIAGNLLMRTDLFGPRNLSFDTPVAEVYQQQSWFTVDHSTNADREVVFGYDRALREWEWFIVVGRASDSRYRYHKIGTLGLRTGETVDSFAVYFSASSVLLVLQTSYQGRDFARYVVIGLDGTVQINQIIESADTTYPYWSNVTGKLHQGRSVLHLSSDGIVKQQLSDGNHEVLPGTAGFVSITDRLLRLQGRVGIVRRGGVLTMTRRQSS